MRVISYESARVTFLVPFEEVVPLEGGNGPEIVRGVVQRYSFGKAPDLSVGRDEINKNGLKFESGQFQFEGREVNIQALTVYNDGLNIDAKTTDHGQAFLDDLLSFLRSEFMFREFTSSPRIHFWSTIIIEFDNPVSRLIEGHEKITAALNRSLSQVYSGDIPPCVFSRLDFSSDPTERGSPIPTPRFVLERRGGVPFGQERYHCAAPMRTHEHLELLETIERLPN
jgi:hypothetical protein